MNELVKQLVDRVAPQIKMNLQWNCSVEYKHFEQFAELFILELNREVSCDKHK